ncbi:MAG: hydroxymethylbilane synthase [Planctomycetaceae bacterium]
MTTTDEQPIRIGTRASQLALWQAHFVSELLKQITSRPVEIVHISTTGDRQQLQPLHQLGNVGVFTREVQLALFDGRADVAVHSLKDLPTISTPELVLAGVPVRGPMFDCLVLPSVGEAVSLSVESLPEKARVGTGSLRRKAQLLFHRPDLDVLPIRGNVDTRLKKLDAGEYDVLVLAAAGLHRLGFAKWPRVELSPPIYYPAAGQGAVGIECREDDRPLHELLQRITDEPTFHAVVAERALLNELEAGCHAPVGSWSRFEKGVQYLDAVVLSLDGRERISASAHIDGHEVKTPDELGRRLAALLRERGADPLLESTRMPSPEN